MDGRISNAKDVSAIYDKGKDQYDQFVNDVIATRNSPLDSRFSSSKSQSDTRRSNRRFLYWKQVSHSLANCTLRLPNAVVIIVIWIRSSHMKHTRSRLRWRMEMRRSIIRQNPASSTASRRKQKLHGAMETDTQQQHDCVVQDGGQLIHFRAVHAEIILEASSGGAVKSVTA